MIKVSVLYPAGEGKTFDFDYYRSTHRPLVQKILGDVLRGMEIERGLSGPFPGSEPPFLACGHLLFESVETLMPALMASAGKIMEDMPNFTNSSPTIQISEVIPD